MAVCFYTGAATKWMEHAAIITVRRKPFATENDEIDALLEQFGAVVAPGKL